MKKQNSNIKFGLQPPNKLLKVLTNTKDKTRTPIEGACYMIPCGGDGTTGCDKCYIGETGRDPVLDRLPEHKRNFEKSQKSINPELKDACVSHAVLKKHKFNFDEIKILDKSKNWKIRIDLEALNIHAYKKNTVNYKSDTQYINSCTKGIIRVFQNQVN